MERVVVSWSGGKDASIALQRTLAAPDREVVELLTTLNEDNRRVSMHGVPETLLVRQADAIGRPLRTVPIPPDASNETYEDRLADPLAEYERHGIDRIVFADIFLEGVRSYRANRLATSPIEGAWPLWGSDTEALAREFVETGFRARLACVNGTALDSEWAGKPVDRDCLSSLPASVDPCGENGEFHTFVTDGPCFRRPVPVSVAGTVSKSVGDGTHHYAALTAGD